MFLRKLTVILVPLGMLLLLCLLLPLFSSLGSFFASLILGLVLGVLLCLAQQHFGIVKLGSAGSFVVDAYPVSVHLSDIVLVFVTVFVVSGLSVWLPVRMLARRLTHSNEGEEEKG